MQCRRAWARLYRSGVRRKKNCSEIAWWAVPAGPRSPDMLGWGRLWSLLLSSVMLLLKNHPCYADAWLNARLHPEAISQWCDGIPGSHTPGPMNAAQFLQKPFCDNRHLETVKETLMMEANAFGDLSG